jgi:hypothetical protein
LILGTFGLAGLMQWMQYVLLPRWQPLLFFVIPVPVPPSQIGNDCLRALLCTQRKLLRKQSC